jgi:peptidoglycan/xylan/chitin deacetylase (PgdA/CDA1 family)
MWRWTTFRCREWQLPGRRLALLAVLAGAAAAPLPAAGAESAAIFAYQRFADPRLPSGSIALELFDAHLGEIATGGFRVTRLDDVVAAFRRRDTLPERAIAITIDDADDSVWREAWPRLRRAGLPFALFVSTDAVDASRRGTMSWDQIRELAASGVTIASQGASQSHFPELGPEAKRRELARANQRFADELGYVPRLFAYPFGEYGQADQRIVRELGFEAAFGQQSGVGHPDADLYGLPRFLMNDAFGSPERFRLAATALPLYLSELTPGDTVLGPGANPPSIGFTLADGQGPVDDLACFASNRPGALRIERLGRGRVEIRLDAPFAPGRGRFNCTLPAGPERWRWFGLQFFISGG